MPEGGRGDELAGAGEEGGAGARRPSPSGRAARADQLARAGEEARRRLAGIHRAREEGLAACRATIQACGRAIRAAHRHETEAYAGLVSEAEGALRRAQSALAPHPAVAGAGFLHDAEKEYAEARLTTVLIAGAVALADAGAAGEQGAAGEEGAAGEQGAAGEEGAAGALEAWPAVQTAAPEAWPGGQASPRRWALPALPDADALGVSVAAWLTGLAEAASELRRHLLDRLRAEELARAEALLAAMEDVYDLLATIDYPDALTGGLRRAADSLRAVLERSRSDLTVTLVQARLRDALERRSVP